MFIPGEHTIDELDLVRNERRATQRIVNASQRDDCVFTLVIREAPQAKRVQEIGKGIDERAVVHVQPWLQTIELCARARIVLCA